MTACQETGEWITENIVTPTERFVEEAVERCKEVSEWIERNVRRRVERDRHRREKKCRKEKCKWYLACLNKLVCWFVTIVERVIEYVVEVVGEWVVKTVCEIVMQTVKIIVDVVTTVTRFVVTGMVCLVTGNWQGALDSVIDFWFDIVGIVESIGVLFEIGFKAVSDFLEITSRFVRDLGEWFGPVGRVIFGTAAGAIDGARQLVDAAGDIIAGAFELITGVARLDFCAASAGLVWGLANGIGKAVPASITIGLLGAPRGIRDSFFDDIARERVRDMFNERFGEFVISDTDITVADRLADSANLDSRTWGVPWTIRPRRLTIPSRSDAINLREMHTADNDFNLYHIAGYAPIWRGNGCFLGYRWQVVYPGTNRRVRVAELRRYINEGRNETVEFEMVSMNSRVFEKNLNTAKRKFRTVGLDFNIEPQETMPVRAVATGGDEFVFSQTWLQDNGGECLRGTDPNTCRTGAESFLNRHDLGESHCVQPAISVFQYEKGNFGLAGVVWPWYDLPTDPDPVQEADNAYIETVYQRDKPTGATYRDSRPDVATGYVLAHELGHAFGLQHEGHNSLHYIMFVPSGEQEWNGEFLKMLTEFLLLGGEPRFTLDDVVRVWEWIVLVAPDCLPEPQLEENRVELLPDMERLRRG